MLLSDYDGTLTPIVSRPEEAVLPPEVRAKLRALVAKPALSVGIISGRALPEVKALVAVDGVYYAGNHGLEIEGPHLSYINPIATASRALLEELARKLSERLGHIEGVIIEDKGLSLSVHYRLVRESDQAQAAQIFAQVTSPQLERGRIRVTSGKKVWEVRPPIDWHKGKAVETIVREIKASLSLRQALSIYLGDDLTDEDAFRAVHRLGGWSILVGQENPLSQASLFLDSPVQVSVFLSRLLELK